MLRTVLLRHIAWRKKTTGGDESLYAGPDADSPAAEFESALCELLDRLDSQFPYASPRYAAQMLKDPSLPYIAGHFAAMLANPNNHAFEGGNVTTPLEMEVVDDLKRLLGFTAGWGHLTSGGSLANMEALWAVRDGGGEGRVLFSASSHYSWKRICSILRVTDFAEVAVDARQRMDLGALRRSLGEGKTLMVMANLGTTGVGAVDPLPEILALRNEFGFHLHVDAAYGGYLRAAVLSGNGEIRPRGEVADLLSPEAYDAMAVLGEVDSATVDPHKHGAAAYGVGGVIFRDEALRDVLLNTCPYTYHVREQPNIGMWQLEGSRPGAAAAGVWLAHRTMPLHAGGMGRIHAECLRSARALASELSSRGRYRLVCPPDLDILCFFDPGDGTVAGANEATGAVYRRLSVENPDAPFVLSKFVLTPEATAASAPDLSRNTGEELVALRAVFIKHWALLGEGRYLGMLVDALHDVDSRGR
jgi:glutamate/tyrosine decarboxylase-like PLP-dependent enzyme